MQIKFVSPSAAYTLISPVVMVLCEKKRARGRVLWLMSNEKGGAKMYCSFCGGVLPKGAMHCPSCGTITPAAVAERGGAPDERTLPSSRLLSNPYERNSSSLLKARHIPVSQRQTFPPPSGRQVKIEIIIGLVLVLVILVMSGVGAFVGFVLWFANQPPVAFAGFNTRLPVNAPLQLDGSESSDPNRKPLTYRWAQISGPTVQLSDTKIAQPTFTSPVDATSLTFQLVVNNGQRSSNPVSVTIDIYKRNNLALSAMATASSESTNTSQTADKSIDGVMTGYPGDSTKEWVTVGGKRGSWLKLTWRTPQTINTVVLYDRPNNIEQITGGYIQFSDGSDVAIGALHNNGSAYSMTFSAKIITSLQLQIASVSDSTYNIGLSEIQVYDILN
jgi:hypothetical protein